MEHNIVEYDRETMSPNDVEVYRLCDYCSVVLKEEDYVFTGKYEDKIQAGMVFPRCPVIICQQCDANKSSNS